MKLKDGGADELINSDALKANLQETAVRQVEIGASYGVLVEVVCDYRGICKNLHELLLEINHPFRNWLIILPRLRAYTLKHNSHYIRHPKGPKAFSRFIDIFLDAVNDSQALAKSKAVTPQVMSHDQSPKNAAAIANLAMESLLAYLEKFINALDQQELKRYKAALNQCFNKLHKLDDHILTYMVQGYHPVKKIAAALLEISGADRKFKLEPFCRLYTKLLRIDYNYWLGEEDPLPWFTKACGHDQDDWNVGNIFAPVSHAAIAAHLAALPPKVSNKGREELIRILELPTHIEIVRLYKDIPNQLLAVPFPNASYPGNTGNDHKVPQTKDLEPQDRFAENRKLLFLFRIMDTQGLFLIHEDTLREINRSLVHLIQRQSFEEIEKFLLTTFQLLKANVNKFPHTALQCIQVLGTEVFKKESGRLVESFLWEVVRFGFQYANVTGVDEDWQPIANPAHLVNIRVWLSLIMREPKWCSTLFSALIINLHLSGTCIKDTDLFQRDITELLNHPIEPLYNLAKQFAKLLPVFFNDIGAEGALREVSTELDETHRRHDVLIHFLRKQSHVESSNLIVAFIEAIFSFWRTKDKELLADFLPPEVLYQVQLEGPFIDDLHILLKRVFELPSHHGVQDLLNWPERERDRFLSRQADLNPVELRRFTLLVEMYVLLYEKYNLGRQDLRQQLEIAANASFPELAELIDVLDSGNTFQCLTAILDHLENLQKIILNKRRFAAKEDIYYKRHIAVDIPSVYGRYQEKKFDALGLTFRLENLARIYLEKIPETVNLSFITEATFIRIINCLKLYLRALKIDGISSRHLESYIALLANSVEQKRFSYTQYLDIFRGLSEGVKDIIYAYYTNVHQNNLSIIAPQIGAQNLLPRYRSLWQEEDQTGSVHRLSESFLRDLIAGTFGLQHLDNFITRIYQTLEIQKELLDEKNLDLLMTYNPENAITFLHKNNSHTDNLLMLGNKGYNLTLLAADHLPVPPGFVVTTEIFRCWPVVKNFFKARDEFMSRIKKAMGELEEMTGKKYGSPDNPLLRSWSQCAAAPPYPCRA